MLKIKSLNARWFRGIVDNPLEFNEKSVVLYGENGYGKSSFVDALEFLFKGKVSHLEGTQSLSTSKHAPHILCEDNKNCCVEIVFQDSSILGRNFREGISKISKHLQTIYQLGTTSSFILRRKHLLDFILAQPKPRYDQLASLIRISDLEQLELALMHRRDELGDTIRQLENQNENLQHRATVILGTPFKNLDSLLNLLNAKLKEYDERPLQKLEEIPERKTEVVSKAKHLEKMKLTSEILSIIEQIQLLNNTLKAFKKYQVFRKTFEDFLKDKESVKDLMCEQLLVLGKDLVIQQNLSKCPLCLTPQNQEEFIAAIETRLKSMEEISPLVNELKRLRNDISSDLVGMKETAILLCGKLRKHGYDGRMDNLEGLISEIDILGTEIGKDIFNIKLDTFEERHKAICSEKIIKTTEEMEEWALQKKSKCAQTNRDKVIITVLEILAKVSEFKNDFQGFCSNIGVRRTLHDQVNIIYDCFVRAKKEEIQKIYDALQGDFSKYYETLHPGDEHHDMKLVVKPERRGSAEIKCRYYHKIDEDPRSYYSEAHLDSLGLCIFLAFVKHFNSEFPIIILDDVIFSIDAEHRNRICELIIKEFKEYQFLITTHDYMWFEELHATQTAFKVEGNFANYEIKKWTLEGGPIYDKYQPRWEKIADKISQGEKDMAAVFGRECLEWLCYEMIIKLKGAPSVLRRDNKYEVKDLYPSFVGRVKKLLPEYYRSNESMFQRLEKNKIFGNICSHNNPIKGGISIEEVKDFVDSLQAVYKLLYCENCRCLVEYHPTARLVKCKCNNGLQWSVKK